MKQRSVGMCVVLSIITCGIYMIYWLVCLNDDVNEVTGRRGGTSGGMVVLFTLLSCGIYGVYWNYKMGERLDEARRQQGVPTGSLAILYLVLSLFGFGIISMALMQNEVNHYTPGRTWEDDDAI